MTEGQERMDRLNERLCTAPYGAGTRLESFIDLFNVGRATEDRGCASGKDPIDGNEEITEL